MRTRTRHLRKPDPLMLLAVLVGLGVVVTTAVQAETSGEQERIGPLREAGARLALKPIKGLAERLDMLWLNTALDRPATYQLLKQRGVGIGKPFGHKGPELSLSWRPKMRSIDAAGDDFWIGAASAARPDIFVGLRRSW